MSPSPASTAAKLPSICSRLRIHRDTEVARGEFRARRLEDPLRDYDIQYPIARAAADAVVDALTQLLAVPADRALLASLVGGKRRIPRCAALPLPRFRQTILIPCSAKK